MSAQPQPRSLWGRLLRAPAKPAKPAKHHPIITPPTHRPLTPKDALYTVADGRRVYVPLTVEGQPGRYAGRCWCHCGDMDGVLLVAWAERDDLAAVMRWCTLADGAVKVIVSTPKD